MGWGRAAVIGGTSLEEFCALDYQNKGSDQDKKELGAATATATTAVSVAGGGAGVEGGNYTLVQSKRALVDLGLIDQR